MGKLIASPSLPIRYVTCHYALVELFKHQAKIIKFAKKSIEDVVDDLSTLMNRLKLYNESLIEKHHWQEAARLTAGIDSFDISYVALSLQMDARLWTGDKKLTTHLRMMGFDRVINTAELGELMNLS